MMRAICFAIALSASPALLADDAAKDEASEPTKLEKALQKFERTGEMEKCVTHSRIRHTRVVDDNHIIFELSGGNYYLNTLPRKCHSLGFHQGIKYTVRGSTVCYREMFSVLDGSSVMGPMCNFGQFEKLEKQKKNTETSSE